MFVYRFRAYKHNRVSLYHRSYTIVSIMRASSWWVVFNSDLWSIKNRNYHSFSFPLIHAATSMIGGEEGEYRSCHAVSTALIGLMTSIVFCFNFVACCVVLCDVYRSHIYHLRYITAIESLPNHYVTIYIYIYIYTDVSSVVTSHPS